MRARLAEKGWPLTIEACQIIPLLVGESKRALELSAALADRGYWVPAVRAPTVPAGQARLRIGLTANHTMEQIEGLTEELAALAGT
jgi:8-amino-7-oxononanoate synthase